MKVWTICISEPLPIDDGRPRLMRAGTLTGMLNATGHDVTWWTSSFNHVDKCQRTAQSTSITTPEGIRLNLLHGVRYSRNVGLGRLLNHYQLGREFRKMAEGQERPDVMFCCWPTIEIAFECVLYARKYSIPIVLDVRDLWPDIFLNELPTKIRSAAKLLVLPYVRMAEFCFRECTAIVGVSNGYLEWGLKYASRERGPLDRVFPLGYREATLPTPAATRRPEKFGLLGVDRSRLICWFVGSFGSTYDLETVIRAARELEIRGLSKYQFVLSGDGERRGDYERLASGLNNIVFTGWLNAEEITCMMQTAHIGLAAYREGAPQGLPNKLFEYMAAGLPIISSLSGECKQFLDVHGCGVSYTARRSDSFIDVLLTLGDNESLRNELGANGLRAFRSHYSASVVYPQLIEYLERFGADASSVKQHGRTALS